MLFSVTSISSSTPGQGTYVPLRNVVDVNHQSMKDNKNILNLSDVSQSTINGKTIFRIDYDQKNSNGAILHISEYYVEAAKTFHNFAFITESLYYGQNAKDTISEFEKTFKFN